MISDFVAGRGVRLRRAPAAARPARRGLRLALLLLPLLLAAGCDDKKPAAGGAQPGQQGGPAPTVLVSPASEQPVSGNADFVGRVEALEKVEIRARVTGFLMERSFQEGQMVKQGDLLFTIEREPFEADVALRQARVESAQATLNFANFQVDRGRELVRTNAIPRATLDERVSEQGTAAAALSAARAELELARINLGYTLITSAIDGRIGRAALTRGNVVGPDSGVLTVVVRQDPIRVVFPVTQRQILEFRRRLDGQAGGVMLKVLVRLPDGSTYAHPGRINFIDVQTDRATDTVLVQAEVPNPQGLLSDGQFLGVRVEGEEQRNAIVIPQSALQIDQQGPFVLVVGEGNKVEVRRVRIARGPAGQTVVESGLTPGTLVIVEGSQRARPGGVVAPRPARAEPQPGTVVPASGGPASPAPANAAPPAAPGTTPPGAPPAGTPGGAAPPRAG